MKENTRRLTLCALLSALALGLSYLEGLFPVLPIPLPGIKLGLANIVTLFVLLQFGASWAFSVLTVRCLLGSIFAGTASALLFSLLGGVAAMTVMALLQHTRLSVYGISAAGAAAHQCGQVLAAMWMLNSTAPMSYLPLLLLISLFTGGLTGFVTALLCRAFQAARLTPDSDKEGFHHGS